MGKKVGGSFVLAKSPVKNRIGKITQILSKYTRRFQAIGDQMELKFGDQTVIRTMHVPPPEKLSAADLQPMLDSIKAHSEAVSKLREVYKSTPMTLHIYGDQLGHSAYGGLFGLAISEDHFVLCAHSRSSCWQVRWRPSEQRAQSFSISSLSRLLGITRQVLTSGGFRFVVSAATYTELQELRAKSRFGTASRDHWTSTMADIGTHHN